jgi:hypothetical protein
MMYVHDAPNLLEVPDVSNVIGVPNVTDVIEVTSILDITDVLMLPMSVMIHMAFHQLLTSPKSQLQGSS